MPQVHTTQPTSTSSSLFSPVCICNWTQHDTMNRKILQHASEARLVQRTVDPRPMMDNRCTTHRKYQATETIDAPMGPSASPLSVNQRFAQLTDVQSKLRGLCRSSAHNSMPMPTSPVAPSSAVWNAFPPPIATLRSHTQPKPKHACLYSTASAQTRGPFMRNAPQCKPTKAEDDVHLWRSPSQSAPTEPPRWNNHPFVLEHRAVHRYLVPHPLLSPIQNPFINSTRRKLCIK